MPDIYHRFIINASAAEIFLSVSTSGGLDRWWTKTSEGNMHESPDFILGFGPGYDWRARVTRYVENREFELTMTKADSDWLNTQIGFILMEINGTTHVEFYHTGWPVLNDHYKISSYCWAMYLRILRRYIEFGELVPYEERLNV